MSIGHPQLLQLQQQQTKLRAGDPIAQSAGLRGITDHEFKQFHQLKKRGHRNSGKRQLAAGPTHQSDLPQPFQTLHTNKVNVVFPHAAGRTIADGVWSLRAIGEDGTGCQSMLTAADRQRAFSFGHQFHGVVRKIRSIDQIIVTHPLHAAAHDGQTGFAIRLQIQEKTARLRDLVGHKKWQRFPGVLFFGRHGRSFKSFRTG